MGEDQFLLPIGQLEALDDLTERGVLDFRFRLLEGYKRGGFENAPVKVAEVINCIRLGLIGGGMDQRQANTRAKRAFEDCDIAELNVLAFTIVSHSLKGKDHDPLGEAEAREAEASESGSLASTETE